VEYPRDYLYLEGKGMNPRQIVIMMSDAVDASLQLRDAAWRDGYEQGRADGEEAGYLRAVAEMKALHRDMVRELGLELERWPPAGRPSFGQPREGDYQGQQPPF